MLNGRIRDHHRFLLQGLTEEVEYVESRIACVEADIERRLEPFHSDIERPCTIPGINRITARTLLSEFGTDMTPFPDDAHAASWAGLCPGNNESAGKRKSNRTRTRKGNRWLRRALCQAAWAVAHSKRNYLTAEFYRRAARHGVRKAVVSTAHQLLVIIYQMLRDKRPYRDLGGDYFDQLNPEKTKRKLARRIERLGYEVVLKPRQPSTCGNTNPS